MSPKRKWIWISCALLFAIGGCNIIKQPAQPIRATTVYIVNGTLGSASLPGYLAANLPAMRQIGFTAVYLPAVWADFDPSPIGGQFNAVAFANAKMALDQISAAGMKAWVGLNYVGVGYAPDFGVLMPKDKACDWARIPEVYASFERYVVEALNQYRLYKDILQFMVFTEGAEGCGLATPEAAPSVALFLQTTLGSLPTRIPPEIRRLWKIGYHDYSIVNLGWGNGVGPIATPNPFDFVSMVAYNTSDPIELDARAGRFKALYSTPLVVGEAGANGCPGANPPQDVADSQLVSWALSRGYGFNIWGWPNAGAAECTNPVYGGYALTDQNGVPNAAAVAISKVLN